MTMWKRGEVVRPPLGGRDVTGAEPPGPPAVASVPRIHEPKTEAIHHMDKDAFNIGKSVIFKGDLSGSEDLVIEGTVEGKIELRDHVVTIGQHAKIKAEVTAKIVIVLGQVSGNITATEKLDIRNSGSVEGDIVSPLVAIAEGAHLRGSVDMQPKLPVAATPPPGAKPEVKLAPLPASAPAPVGQRAAGA
jgi:cytoskeletal protein CcmA (bactofilin family)